MGAINLILWVSGAILIVVGYRRAKAPWLRYQALKEQDANASRYAAWRGGIRTTSDETTGASVAMRSNLQRARMAGLIAVVGFVLVFLGFFIR